MSFTNQEIVDSVGCCFCGVLKGDVCVDRRFDRPTRNPHPSRVDDGGHALVGEHPGELPEMKWDGQ